jgi:hypothetical protein
MSPVLDATEVQDETQLTQEQEEQTEQGIPEALTQPTVADRTPDIVTMIEPARTITLETLEECETSIMLLIQSDSIGLWHSGYRIKRNYDCSPHEQEQEELPSAEDTEEFCVDTIGEAVLDAANKAEAWLAFHSNYDDMWSEMSRIRIRNWPSDFEKFKEDTENGSIFDKILAVGNSPVEVQPIYEDRCPACDRMANTGAPAITSPAEQSADDFHTKRCQELAWEIATNHIELAKAKASVKRLNKAIESAVAELESAEEDGPEELPLFDQANRTPIQQEQTKLPSCSGNTDDCTCPTCSQARVDRQATTTEDVTDASEATPDTEDWRSVTVEQLGISPAICKILRESQEKPIATLGDIADHCKEYQLTDLKKIGEAKAEKIQEAMDAYWAAQLDNAE